MTVSFRLTLPFLCAIFLTLVRALGQEKVTADSNPVVVGAPAASLAPTPISWLAWGSVFTGVGLLDNVLLSHAGEERSGFVRGGVDATAWNVKHDRFDYWASMRMSGTRYFTARTVDHEEEAILLTELNGRVGNLFKASIDGSASYSHLIYDVSDTDVQQVVSEIKRSSIGLGPTIRWTFHAKWWAEVAGGERRETYPDGLNNRSILEDALRVGWKPGTRFEAIVAGSEWHRNFDSRPQYSVNGRSLNGTVLATIEREAELRLKAVLDNSGHWKTFTRASVTRFADNGAGFLNYRERKVGQEIDWEAGNWLIEFEATARRVEYGLQTVGFGIYPPPRVRDAYFARILVERKLTAHWTAYAEYTWERNRCNDPVSSYFMNEGLLGIRWNWEK